MQGDWYAEPLNELISELNPDKPFNVVYAHNDVMALETKRLLSKRNLLLPNAIVIGIDALAAEGGGMHMVKNGDLDFTLLYPTGGARAIETAIKVLTGQHFNSHQEPSSIVVDAKNVDRLLEESQQFKNQEKQIETIDGLLRERDAAFEQQRIVLWLTSAIALIAMVFGVLLFFSNKQKKKSNTELKEQNALRDKLIGIISHDTRSPLNNLIGVMEMFENETLSLEQTKKMAGELKLKTQQVLTENEAVIEWAKSQ
ncbi:MAG: hypothetical protein KDC92_03130, partial [Bacteroidetes bacterium]|nr:hypothetical protein [Bacteroidota bacterium]